MTDKSKLIKALSQLDSANPNHWTADGLPRLDTLKMLAGDPALTREAVTAVAPGYSRENRAPLEGTEPVSADAGTQAQQSTTTEQGGDNGEAGDGSGAAGADADPAAGQAVAPAPEDDELAAAQRALDIAVAAEAEAKRAVAEATAEVDRLVEARTKAGDAPSFAATVQGYLLTQQREREARGARMAEMRGIPLKELLPKPAAIDAAFARKKGFGNQRPRR